MADSDFGSVLNATSNMAVAAMNYGEKKGAQKRNFEYSKQYFDYTFDKQNERQDYLNANQMRILKNSYRDAGLSSAGLGSSGQSVLAGASPTGQNQSFNMDAYQTTILKDIAELGLLKAQTENVQSNTAKTDAETEGINITNDNLDAILKNQLKLSDQQIASLDQSVKESIQRVANDNQRLVNENNLTKAQVDKTASEIGLNDAMKELKQVEKQLSDINVQWLPKVLASQIAYNYAGANYSNAQAKYSVASIPLIGKNLALLDSQIKLNGQQGEKLGAEILNIKANTTKEDFFNQVRANCGIDPYVNAETEKCLSALYQNRLTIAKTIESGAQTVELGTRSAKNVSDAISFWW